MGCHFRSLGLKTNYRRTFRADSVRIPLGYLKVFGHKFENPGKKISGDFSGDSSGNFSRDSSGNFRTNKKQSQTLMTNISPEDTGTDLLKCRERRTKCEDYKMRGPDWPRQAKPSSTDTFPETLPETSEQVKNNHKHLWQTYLQRILHSIPNLEGMFLFGGADLLKCRERRTKCEDYKMRGPDWPRQAKPFSTETSRDSSGNFRTN